MRPLSRRRALGLALTLAAVTLSGCNPFGRTYTYRYRITVEVDTPQGLRTGSSVWESSVEEEAGSGTTAKACTLGAKQCR